jgi:hypothetical protein
MGRIHSAGRLPARDLDTVLEWVLVGNGIVDVSENELELWYSPQDRFAVSVRPPGGNWIGPLEPLEFIENQRLADGSFVSIYNELYHPANGANCLSVYLSPFLNPAGIVGIPAGTWTVRLHAREARDGRFHAWIERDDPRRLGRIGQREAWSFPSFFSARSNVDSSSVSSLACGHAVVGVANLDEAGERINISSSQGPTRDGRSKPDVAAPGTEIVAANGFAGPDEPWIAMTGTSMASPYVAGVAGLMLAAEPRLTAAQIGGIMQRTARPLPGADFSWLTDAGFGRIDPAVRCRSDERQPAHGSNAVSGHRRPPGRRPVQASDEAHGLSGSQGRLPPPGGRGRTSDARRWRDAARICRARGTGPVGPAGPQRRRPYRSRLRVAHRPRPHRRDPEASR